MIVEINGKEHFFNENKANLDKKFNPIVKIWYFIFCGICVLNIFFYLKGIHRSMELLISIPFFHIFVTYIFWIIKWVKASPNGDHEYIKTYYPEIAKKLNIGGRNSFAWMAFLNGEYLDYKIDLIMDDIRDRQDENNKLVIMPFKIFGIFFIISIVVLLIIATK